MKKFIMAMAAVAMLCAGLTSCSKESDIEEIVNNETQKKDIKFDFNFNAGSQSDTRATQKTAWEEGDIIYVGFASQNQGLLKFTYDGENWSEPATIGTINLKAVASATDNTCLAFWVEGNPGDADLEEGNNWGYSFAHKNQCRLYHTNVEYTYVESTNTISAKFTLKRDPNSVKIAVSGLGDDTWQICAKEFMYISGSATGGNIWNCSTSVGTGNRQYFTGGYEIGDETCFYVILSAYSNAKSADAGSVIYLKNTTTNKIYRRLFSKKKLDSMGGKTINITYNDSWSEISANEFNCLTSSTMDVIPSPTTGIYNGHAWVDLGIRKSDFDTSITPGSVDDRRIVFATCNIGADNPEDFGYYFRWGEQQGWQITLSDKTVTSAKQYDKNGNATSLIWASTTFSSTGWALNSQETAVDFQGKTNLTCNSQTYGDAATYNWGDGWMMMNYDLANKFNTYSGGALPKYWYTPSSAYVKASTKYQNDVGGLELKNENTGASVFLPGAGYIDGETYSTGGYMSGYYWLSTPYDGNGYKIYYPYNQFRLFSEKRYLGYPIRPIAELPLE